MLFRLLAAVMARLAQALQWVKHRLAALWALVLRLLCPVRAWLVERVATSAAAVVGLAALTLGCWPLFQWRNAHLGAEQAIPDGQLWYSADYLTGFFATAGPSGRMIYAASQLTLDLVFPVAYASLLTVLVHLVWRDRGFGFLWPLPLLAGIADVAENLLLSGQALAFDGQVSIGLATLAALFTLSKLLLLSASILLLGGVFGLGDSWWVAALGLVWVAAAGALVLLFPAALVPALLLAIVVHRRWLHLFQYLFFLRYALLGAAGLVLLPTLALSEAGRGLLRNLLVLPERSQMLFVSFLAGMLSMTLMWATRIVLRTAPDRLGISLARRDAPSLRRALGVCGPTDPDTSLDAASRRQKALAELNFDYVRGVAPALLPLAPWIFALLSIPFLWTVRAESHGSWASLAMMLSVVAVCALLARLLLTKGRRYVEEMTAQMRRQPWAETPLGRAVTHPAHAPIVGFGGKGHLPLLLFVLVVASVYAAFGLFLDPSSEGFPDGFPAVGFLLLIAVVAVWALSTLALVFDRARVPVIATTLALLLFASLTFDSDHYYRVVPRRDGVDRLPTPVQAFAAWRQAHPTEEYVTVVAASGGGIKASLWTATVMRALLTTPAGPASPRGRSELGSSIVLLSTTSGGSVGGMYVTQAFAEGEPPGPTALDRVVQLSGDSSLTASVWGMAYPDLWHFLSGGLLSLGTLDRGWAMDRRWERRRASLEASPAPRGGSAGRALRTLGDWSRDVTAGVRPAHIFNATVVESGAAFRLASVDLVRESQTTAAGSHPHEFWDFYDCARADIEVATAARLSATFPWISPMARAWAGPELTSGMDSCFVNDSAAFRLADGGYFDNFGVFSAIEFLENIGTASLKQSGIRRVLFVQIRATPESSATMKEGGLHYSLFGPVMAMNSVRTSSQIARNNLEVDLLSGSWTHEEVKVVPVVFDLPKAGPLSWHLSRADREGIETAWDETHEDRLVAALDELLGEEAPPSDLGRGEEPAPLHEPPGEADASTEQ